MSSTNSSSEKHNITSRTWNSEDMVTSNISSETGISQLMGTASTFIYPADLSASAHELKNTSESQQSNVVSVPQNSIFAYQDFISVEELRKLAEVSNQIYSSTPSSSNSTLPVINHAPVTPVKPIQPALFNSSVSSPRSEVDGSERSSSPATNENNNKKKATGGRKRKAESLEEKEQRQRERILRNRHAAQMSRDKKRRQMADLESQNVLLKEENAHLSKRLKIVEEENIALSAKLDTISAQLSEIQSHITVSEMTKVLLDGVRGSAASATLEPDSLALNDDGKEENTPFNDIQNEILESSSRYVSNARESSEKSQQRHVKMWNLYGTLSQIHSFPNWMLPTQILKQLLLIFSIVFWTMTGQQKNFLPLGNWMVFVDDVVILELAQRFNKKRRMRSVKALRGNALNLMRVPRDWRKYPP